jgi:hypothetical protein
MSKLFARIRVWSTTSWTRTYARGDTIRAGLKDALRHAMGDGGIIPGTPKPPPLSLPGEVILTRTGAKQQPVGPDFVEWLSRVCPDCGGDEFMRGPSGGLSINIECVGCGARFNIVHHAAAAPGVILIERIANTGPWPPRGPWIPPDDG